METALMNAKDVADLLFAARARIDFYWNFYAVVVVAVTSWLVSLKKTLTRPTKALVTVAYLVAATMNLVGLCGSYGLAEALRADLLRIAVNTPLTDTIRLVKEHSYMTQRLVAVSVHVVVGATILLVVWFARFSEPEAVAETAIGGTNVKNSPR